MQRDRSIVELLGDVGPADRPRGAYAPSLLFELTLAREYRRLAIVSRMLSWALVAIAGGGALALLLSVGVPMDTVIGAGVGLLLGAISSALLLRQSRIESMARTFEDALESSVATPRALGGWHDLPPMAAYGPATDTEHLPELEPLSDAEIARRMEIAVSEAEARIRTSEEFGWRESS